ncbi:MAG: hypothetical protein J6C44_01205 [Muribaculaceae bacterium]|nr:hypothetical protein [Muribaculaceae bacterium]
MKVIQLMVASVSILALSACSDGLGSPEEAGAKVAEMEHELNMQKLDQEEKLNDMDIESAEFGFEVYKKYGKDKAAQIKIDAAEEAKKLEFKNELEDRRKEVERKEEDAMKAVNIERESILKQINKAE